MNGLLGSLSEGDRALGLLNLGAGMLGGNRGPSKGQAFQSAVASGVGNYTNTLGLLGRQQLLRQESEQRDAYRQAQEARIRQQIEAERQQMALQQRAGQILGMIGQPMPSQYSGSVQNAFGMPPSERVFGIEDAIRELAPIPGGLDMVKKYMEAQPQYEIRQGVENGRPTERYVPKNPGMGAPRATGNTPYQKELDPDIRQAAIDDRVSMEKAIDPLMRGRAREGAARVTQTIEHKQNTKFADALGALDVDRLNKSHAGAKDAVDALASVTQAREAIAKGAFQGGGASVKAQIVNTLKGMGVPLPEGIDAQLSNTQALRSALGQGLLEKAKTLGANPSNADAKRIDTIVGTIDTDPNAMEKILDWQEEQAIRAIEGHKRTVNDLRATYPDAKLGPSYDVSAPGKQGAPRDGWMAERPPAAQSKGRIVEDEQGNKFKSDGMTWRPL